MASKIYVIEALMPCPHCGGDVQLRKGKTASVDCPSCKSHMHIGWGDAIANDSRMVKLAIARWNRRAK